MHAIPTTTRRGSAKPAAKVKKSQNVPRMEVAGLWNPGRMLSRISSKSAMYSDLHVLMAGWQGDSSPDFQEMILVENILGKPTAAARKKAFLELNARYGFAPVGAAMFSAFLREWKASSSATERALIAFVLFALNDRTVMVISCDWLSPRLHQPSSDLRPGDLEAFFQRISQSTHPEVGAWSSETLSRVVRHYLASVRDFGLAQGGAKKSSVKPALYPGPVRLLIAGAQLAGCSASRIVHHEAFKILGIKPGEVVNALASLHGKAALHFRMQADIIELSL